MLSIATRSACTITSTTSSCIPIRSTVSLKLICQTCFHLIQAYELWYCWCYLLHLCISTKQKSVSSKRAEYGATPKFHYDAAGTYISFKITFSLLGNQYNLANKLFYFNFDCIIRKWWKIWTKIPITKVDKSLSTKLSRLTSIYSL